MTKKHYSFTFILENENLSFGERILWTILYNKTEKDGTCSVTKSQLASLLKISDRATHDLTKSLEEKKYITVKKKWIQEKVKRLQCTYSLMWHSSFKNEYFEDDNFFEKKLQKEKEKKQ